MAWKYNPFTDALDKVGSGGGTSYIDGDVEYHSNLPVAVGTPAVNSAFLVRKGEGLYFISRRPAGIWVRELNNGNLDDWKYAGTFSDLYRDANFRILNNADVSKELAFDLSGIATGTTRTISVPDANVTLDDAGDSRTPSSHAASHASAGSDPLFDQDLNTTDDVQFNGLKIYTAASPTVAKQVLVADDEGLVVGITGNEADARASLGLGDSATADIGTAAGEVAAGDHGHGNLSSDGKLGTTAGLPVVTTTAGAVTTLALGTAGQVLTVNSGANGVEFAAASGGSGGTKTYAVFTATDNNPPATDFATIDQRNSIACLDFSDTATESAVFVGVMPEGAVLTSGLIVRLHWVGTAITGNVRWSVAFERGNTDLDADSFDTATAATATTSGTSGIVTVTAITCTNIDSIAAGDLFRLRVQRLGADAADTMTGAKGCELVAVEVRSAA